MRVKLNSNGYTKKYEKDKNVSIVGDYNNDAEIQEWIVNGGIVEPEFTEAELLTQAQEELSNAVQSHLDSKAREFRYDDMKSARSYAGYTNAFQAEAISLGQWASECWVYAGQVEADVLAGTRTMPTPTELIAELPVYVGL